MAKALIGKRGADRQTQGKSRSAHHIYGRSREQDAVDDEGDVHDHVQRRINGPIT